MIRRSRSEIADCLAFGARRSSVSEKFSDYAREVWSKLMDFGLMTQLGIPANGKLTGTPGYLPPEVVKGGIIDASSDLYSVRLQFLVSMNSVTKTTVQ